MQWRPAVSRLTILVAVGIIGGALSCVGAAPKATPRAALSPTPPPLTRRLSSHEHDCDLRRSSTGFLSTMEEIMILRCKGVDFVATEPNNLVGHVDIETPEQALEYVRFFTAPESNELFSLGGLTEIMPGDDEGGFNVVRPEVFAKYFKPPSVEERYEHAFCKMDLPLLCGESFTVTRPVLDSEGRAIELGEVVFHSGFRYVLTKEVVLEHAEVIDLRYLGVH